MSENVPTARVKPVTMSGPLSAHSAAYNMQPVSSNLEEYEAVSFRLRKDIQCRLQYVHFVPDWQEGQK